MREYTAKACLPKHLRRQEEDYVFMYVSNLSAEANAKEDENPTLVDVYFACMPELQRRHNDVVMTHTKGNLIQYNACLPKLLRRQEYYPFGLQTANSWTRENTTGNNFLGNGGTELNTTSNLYDLEYRNYDPILGRMNGVDPMATKYASLSPYNFSFNDPVTFNDPSGADPDYGITRYTYDDRVDHYRGEFYSGGSTSALRFHTGGRNSGIINWSYAPSFAQLVQMQNSAEAARNDPAAMQEYGQKYGRNVNWWLVYGDNPSGGNPSMYLYFRPTFHNDFSSMQWFAAVKGKNANEYANTYQPWSINRVADYNKLANFTAENFGNEVYSLRNSFRLSIDYDWQDLNPSEREKGKTWWAYNHAIRVALSLGTVIDDRNLYVILGHELFHSQDFDSGFRDKIYDQFEYSSAKAILEIRAYNHSILLAQDKQYYELVNNQLNTVTELSKVKLSPKR